jgi:DUF1009 family protein
MLQRIASLPERSASGPLRGVLAKGPKPGQELRVDMPAVGPRTVERAVTAGLAGVVAEAGVVLVLDRTEAVRIADAAGCALCGLEAASLPAPAAVSAAPSVGRVIGRHRPGRRDAADIETGLAATTALAPFATGAGVVAVRRYILAMEAAEGPLALLGRVRALRQWGLRWRKAGVMVRRADAPDGDSSTLEAILAEAAAQELAGLAVVGQPHALAPCEEAARLADDLGLFLVLCEPP